MCVRVCIFCIFTCCCNYVEYDFHIVFTLHNIKRFRYMFVIIVLSWLHIHVFYDLSKMLILCYWCCLFSCSSSYFCWHVNDIVWFLIHVDNLLLILVLIFNICITCQSTCSFISISCDCYVNDSNDSIIISWWFALDVHDVFVILVLC